MATPQNPLAEIERSWPHYLPALLLGVLCVASGCGRGDEREVAAAPSVAASPGSQPVIRVAADSPELKQLRVAPVDVAELPADQVVAPGRVVANPNRIARVLLPAPGRITEVLASLGSAVERGQPVLSIESPDADSAIAGHLQAGAAERQARAALAKAQADADRARDLYEVRAIAERELLSAQNDLAQAQGAVDAARAAREQAARRLELLGLAPTEGKQRILVRAPIDGKVLEVNVAPGEYRSDTAAPLMTVADLATVWVASDVPESSVRLVRVGDPVTIDFLAYPGEIFRGRVARIADTVDPQTRTLKMYVELANPRGQLRPEMYGTVRHGGAMRAGPVLPASAIVQEYGRATVYLERAPGQYERRAVNVGPPVGNRVPVLDGVAPGDRVVVDGAILLKDR
jgi:cobalt-zinc-cadmium efflux system membrane fusion protein